MQKKSGFQQIAISVLDESGREVSNLHADDFVVKFGEEVLPLQFMEYQADGPTSVLILADTSGSTEPKLPQTRVAITQIVNNLDQRDEVALFAFSGKPYKLQSFTQDHSAIIDREKTLYAYGPTSLYDSVYTSTHILHDGCYARRLLIVISDGMDNTSVKRLSEVRDEIRSYRVSAYAIALGGPKTSGTSKLDLSPLLFGPPQEPMDEKSLGRLIARTGGSTFKVDAIGDQDLLAAVVKLILAAGRGQYVLAFVEPFKIDPAALTIQIKNHEKYLVTIQQSAPTVPTKVTSSSNP